PEVADWDKRLDRAKRALQSVAAGDADCIGRLTTAAGDVNDVSQEAFRRLLEDSPIPLSARLDAAERSGDTAAIAAVQRLMTEPATFSSRRRPPRTTESSASRFCSRSPI